MLHIVLPEPRNGYKVQNPYYYASTGVPLFINEILKKHNCLRNELKIAIFGGAESIRNNDVFNVGIKNAKAVEDNLLCERLKIDKKETGGFVSRTIELGINTGIIKVTYQPIKI